MHFLYRRDQVIRTRRCSQPEPAGWLTDKSNVSGGRLRWLTVCVNCEHMEWLSFIAFFCFYFAGLLFWPVFQILHRHWTACAKRLLAVFLITSLALIVCRILCFGYLGDHTLLVWLLFPLCNLVSLFASTIICIVSPKNVSS